MWPFGISCNIVCSRREVGLGLLVRQQDIVEDSSGFSEEDPGGGNSEPGWRFVPDRSCSRAKRSCSAIENWVCLGGMLGSVWKRGRGMYTFLVTRFAERGAWKSWE